MDCHKVNWLQLLKKGRIHRQAGSLRTTLIPFVLQQLTGLRQGTFTLHSRREGQDWVLPPRMACITMRHS